MTSTPHKRHGTLGHKHGHGGAHATSRTSVQSLTWTLVLAASYMIAEVVGGLLSNSLALLADAGHMLSDTASVALALFALWIGRRPPSATFSYGYRRAEVLAAFTNAVVLLAVAVGICLEAYQRFHEQPPVDGALMLGVAAGGLAVNLTMLWLLSGGRGENLNVEGAWLHVLSDLLGSIGAVVSGLLTWLRGWYWVDPVASVVIALIVASSGLSLLKRTATVLMEGTPPHIDTRAVSERLAGLARVHSVHHLHVWTITGGVDALSAHVVIERGCDHDVLLERIRATLLREFQLDHVTIQFEHQHCGDEHGQAGL